MEAYNDTDLTDTIYTQAVDLAEALTSNKDKTVTLIGGYDCSHSSVISETVVRGSITVNAGQVIVNGITIR